MSDPGIAADDEAGVGDQGSQSAKIKPPTIDTAGQDTVTAEASGASYGEAAFAFRCGSGNADGVTGTGQGVSDGSEAANWPAASLGMSARVHDHRIRNRWQLGRGGKL